ncbi:sugar transferase [Cetobacterium sp.]|uniref:sugar transferase n=1 Tax=Cetobacterium sp. TaxID=2071632 RepID=UPI003F306009
MLKRIFDILVSFLLIIITIPLFILIAICIKVTSKGTIFFLQKRPGKKGELFKIFKFRTMELGSDKMTKGVEVLKNDPRITKIGKILRRTKIDELPQLINVLKGDMSLVGPRPERIDSLNDYTDEISKRLLVRPGMTGLAQVSGNIYLTLQERYKLDIYYVENQNFLLDTKILLRTIGVVLFGEEKYRNQNIKRIKK